MIVITDKVTCCGCWACENICPKHCVVMKEDNEGFRYPEVDVEVCIECGLCEAVCPILHKPIKEHEKQLVMLFSIKIIIYEEIVHLGDFLVLSVIMFEPKWICFWCYL